ncbi:MAG TPA: tetratricopeptide repeat protein [Terriglobales bacterium]|nr:tetratricopeptide repeat protein [Terriglobales bacterium]
MKRWQFIALLVGCPTLLFGQLPSPGSPAPKGASALPVTNSSSDKQGTPSSPDDPRFTVSVTSLAAPEKAQRAFEKGEEEARKGKWQSAAENFKKAVAMYPRYAIAWLELGRVKARESSWSDARHCFEQAVTQEPKLVDGYLELAHVAAQEQNWQDLANESEHLLQISPDSSAEYWFLNSAAYYNLGNLDRAEASVTRGLRLDSRHDFVQMQYLYGLILGSKKQYKAAAEHVSEYLRLAPDADDSQAARNLLAGYEYRAKLEQQEQEEQ